MQHTLPPGSRIGILGGGQLGRMTAISAAELGYRVSVFCPEKDPPAAQVSNDLITADYNNKTELDNFASKVRYPNVLVLTVIFICCLGRCYHV